MGERRISGVPLPAAQWRVAHEARRENPCCGCRRRDRGPTVANACLNEARPARKAGINRWPGPGAARHSVPLAGPPGAARLRTAGEARKGEGSGREGLVEEPRPASRPAG
jgi:hypothetical protein